MTKLGRISILMVAACAAAPAWAQSADPTYQLSIPRESLDTALKDFARQTGLQVARINKMVDGGVLVGPVSGKLSAQKALYSLLATTGLTYKRVNDHTFAVVKDIQNTEQSSNKARSPATETHSSTADPSASGAPSQEVPAPTAPENSGANAEPSADIGHVTITGSRIRAASPTASVMIIDRDTIDKRGFSTVEDIVRSLPQNASTTNTTRSLSQPVAGDGLPVGPAAQGESEANLRGLGQGATLVLIDGRRTSASAAFSGEAVNLSSIPVAAIERVEILADSAAAVYGSDAIGGVINIVLRKNYSGSNSSIRYEQAANGGDKAAFDQLLGFHWSSGDVTGTFSASHELPIDTRRAGYTTNNLAGLGGIDFRLPYVSQPGKIMGPGVNGSLPATFSGNEPWTAADISPANFQPADLIPRDFSSDVRTRQLYLSARQTLSDRVQAFADVRWSNRHAAAQGAPPVFGPVIDADNPYNHLGETVFAEYAPIYEIEHGLIPAIVAQNVLTTTSVDVGTSINLPVRDWKVDVTGTYSTSRNKSLAFTYTEYDVVKRDYTDFDTAMSSKLNPFGNGTAQNLTFLRDNYLPSPTNTDRKTILESGVLSLEGGLFTLPAGEVRMAAGGEFRHEALSYASDDYLAVLDLGDHHPSQNIGAAFAETSVPVLESLTTSLQGRWEHYSVSSTNPTIDGKTFSKFSPRLGAAWKGPDRLIVRASWGRSFKAPGLNELSIAPTYGAFAGQVFDPIQNRTVPVYFDTLPNPNLRPESGETVSGGFQWAPRELEGLQLSATFNRTRFYNQIQGSLRGSLGTLSTSDALARPDVFPTLGLRGPDGTLLRIQDSSVNVASVTVRSVDFDVNYDRSTRWGLFSAVLQGTVTLSYDHQLTPLSPVEDLAGTTLIDKRRAVLSLGWSRGAYGANIYGNYTGPYLDTEIINLNRSAANVAPIRVPSRTTWDFSMFYNAPWDIKVSGGVKDLFNARFPFAQAADGPFDSRRVDLRGRVVHLELAKAFAF